MSVTNQHIPRHRIDVSEAQWAMIAMHLVTAICGQRLWRTPVFDTGLEVNQLIGMAAIFSSLIVIYRNILIIMGQKTPLDELGIEIKRRTSYLWKPAFPIAILTASAIVSYSIGYFHVSPSLFIFTFGFAFAKITIRLVVSLSSSLFFTTQGGVYNFTLPLPTA